ncbi:MAG: T9SS type A sorting domain-containing protein, partial [bacterium]|nr:T9SS type A sorting domain-containing protein [bacterium]
SFGTRVGVEEQGKIPDKFTLSLATPNPSMRNIVIKYGLPEKVGVNLSLYNLSGRLVKTFCLGEQKPGYYETTVNYNELAKGVYFAKFSAGRYKETKKIILIK